MSSFAEKCESDDKIYLTGSDYREYFANFACKMSRGGEGECFAR